MMVEIAKMNPAIMQIAGDLIVKIHGLGWR